MKGDIERVAWIIILGIMCINILNLFLGMWATNYAYEKVNQYQSGSGYYNHYDPSNVFNYK